MTDHQSVVAGSQRLRKRTQTLGRIFETLAGRRSKMNGVALPLREHLRRAQLEPFEGLPFPGSEIDLA